MKFHTFKILRKEGIILNVVLCFLLLSPIYIIDSFLTTILLILLLYRDFLNNSAPTANFIKIYKTYLCHKKIIFRLNSTILYILNFINILFLIILFITKQITLDLIKYSFQIALLNGLAFYAFICSNLITYISIYNNDLPILSKKTIQIIFLISSLLLFLLLWYLFQNNHHITFFLIILILLITWMSSFKLRYNEENFRK